jgi:hypothetical protein
VFPEAGEKFGGKSIFSFLFDASKRNRPSGARTAKRKKKIEFRKISR